MTVTNKITAKAVVFLIAAFSIVSYPLLITPVATALSCNSCVDGGDIVNRSLTGSDLADKAVDSRAIANNAVTSSDLANDIILNSLEVDTIFVNNLFNTQFLNLGAAVVQTIADNGNGGTAATYTLDSSNTSAFLGLNCLDANGCDVTMGEDFFDGDVIFVYSESTNATNFADTSGVSELAGNFAMGQWDTLSLIFRDDASTNGWLEFGRSNN